MKREAVKGDLVLAGKALAGTSLAVAGTYLVATAPTHVHVYWPYWLFLGCFIVGIALYLGGQPTTVEDASPPPKLAGAAVTDRWRSRLDGVSSDMLRLQHNSMSHPGYMRRSSLTGDPPSIRIGLRVACARLNAAAMTSELRANFLGFLQQSAVMDLVGELTEIQDGARWTARDENPPFNFGAVLAAPGSGEAPIAWARLLLPEEIKRNGRDATSAYLVLYVEPRTADGPAPPVSLAKWHERLSGVLKLPTAFAAFLTDDLGLPTTDDPPSEVGVWLQAAAALTELVEVEGFDMVEGSPQSNWFMGFAVADPQGQQLSSLVLAWLRQLCDSSLHLVDYESDLASLGSSARGPRLTMRVVQEVWGEWNTDVCTAAVEVELSNVADSPIRIAEVWLSGAWGKPPPGEQPKPGHAQLAVVDGVVVHLNWPRYSPPLASHRSVPPHGSVTGWVIAFTALGTGGVPQVELGVRETVGTTYVKVLSTTDQKFSSA